MPFAEQMNFHSSSLIQSIAIIFGRTDYSKHFFEVRIFLLTLEFEMMETHADCCLLWVSDFQSVALLLVIPYVSEPIFSPCYFLLLL